MKKIWLSIVLCSVGMAADAGMDWVDSIVERRFDESVFCYRTIEQECQNPIIDIQCKCLQFISDAEFLKKVNGCLQAAALERVDRFLGNVLTREEELYEEFCLDNTLHTESTPIYISDSLISILDSSYYYYANCAHGSDRYHGFNFYREDGSLIELTYEILSSPERSLKEFVTGYCENILKTQKVGYFDDDGFKSELEQKYVETFLLTGDSLVVIFQPYTVQGLMDYPYSIRVSLMDIKPYLKDEWQPVLIKQSA